MHDAIPCGCAAMLAAGVLQAADSALACDLSTHMNPRDEPAIDESWQAGWIVCGSEYNRPWHLLDAIPLLCKDGPCCQVCLMASLCTAEDCVHLIHEDDRRPPWLASLEVPKFGCEREYRRHSLLCVSILAMPHHIGADSQEEAPILLRRNLQAPPTLSAERPRSGSCCMCDMTKRSTPPSTIRFPLLNSEEQAQMLRHWIHSQVLYPPKVLR
jgi:hypothetical protein